MNKRSQWIAAAVLAVGIGTAGAAQACGCHRHVVRTTQISTTRLAPVGEYTVIRQRPVIVSRTWYNEGLAPVGERIITRRVVACPAPIGERVVVRRMAACPAPVGERVIVRSISACPAPVGERVIVRRTVFPEPARTIVYQPAPVGERIVTRRTVVMTSAEPVAEEQPGFFTSVGNVASAPFRWVGGAFAEPAAEPVVEPVGERVVVYRTHRIHRIHHIRRYYY